MALVQIGGEYDRLSALKAGAVDAAEFHAFAERILARPETAGHGVADEADALGVSPVGGGEGEEAGGHEQGGAHLGRVVAQPLPFQAEPPQQQKKQHNGGHQPSQQKARGAVPFRDEADAAGEVDPHLVAGDVPGAVER